MSDAERLREIAGDISATNNAEDASRAAALWDIADRLEKREAFTKAAEAYCKAEYRGYNYAREHVAMTIAYGAMKEAERE